MRVAGAVDRAPPGAPRRIEQDEERRKRVPRQEDPLPDIPCCGESTRFHWGRQVPVHEGQLRSLTQRVSGG